MDCDKQLSPAQKQARSHSAVCAVPLIAPFWGGVPPTFGFFQKPPILWNKLHLQQQSRSKKKKKK